MSKTVAAGIVTASASNSQTVYYAIALGFASPIRLTSWNAPVYISGSAYSPRPGGLLVGALEHDDSGDSISIRVAHDWRDAADVGRLDLSEGAEGITVDVYRLNLTGAGQLVLNTWSGLVTGFSVDGAWCSFSGKQVAGWRSGPANRIVSTGCPYTFKDEECDHNGSETRCAYTLGDCRAKIKAPVFTGGGLNDITVSGIHSGSGPQVLYVEVDDDSADPETFKWAIVDPSDTYPPASWTTGVAMDTTEILLDDGVSVLWEAAVGHTNGDYWTVALSNEGRFGGETALPQEGEIIRLGFDGVSVPPAEGGGGVFQWPTQPTPPAGSSGGTTPGGSVPPWNGPVGVGDPPRGVGGRF